MRRKGNLRQKIMVGFLSVMLGMGMAAGLTPITAHATETGTGVDVPESSPGTSGTGGIMTEPQEEPQEEPYTYTVKDGKATITEYTGSEGEISIPSIVGDNIPVTAIGDSAFEMRTGLTSITIPASVTSIGNKAFYGCRSLDNITIPSSVTSIGNEAFFGCSSLDDITIPSSVTSIGDSTFWKCEGLKSITIPSGVTSIGSNAFKLCTGLTSITIPSDSVMTSIGNGAFNACMSLDNITIPSSVTSIGSEAFYECSGLTSVEIPSGVTSIGDGCFLKCTNLETVTVKAEESVKIADDTHVFGFCSSNLKIIVPDGKGKDYKAAWPTWEKYIQEAPHTFSTDWSKDTENHWHAATCKHTSEISDKATHSFGEWTVTKEATASAKGSQKRSCTICGYEQTEEIPMKVPEPTSEGKIETDKEQGENAPATDFATPEKDLIGAVLTEEEQDLVKAGTDIKIILDIDNIDDSVNQSDKQAVTAKADGYSVGQYLDINLYKIINGNKENKEKISQTSGKIRIVIAVPESVKNTDSKKTRSYAVVRVHDGVADLLTDLDNDEATITIETDRFSTYALVYKDSTGGDTKKTDQNLSPATGDDTPIEMCVVLIMLAGLSCLTLFTVNRKKNMRI